METEITLPPHKLHSWPRWHLKDNGHSNLSQEMLKLILGLVIMLDQIKLELFFSNFKKWLFLPVEMAKNFRKNLSCQYIRTPSISLWYMSGVNKVLQGIGALGQVLFDMGFSTCTVSIVTYIFYGLLFQKQFCLC